MNPIQGNKIDDGLEKQVLDGGGDVIEEGENYSNVYDALVCETRRKREEIM